MAGTTRDNIAFNQGVGGDTFLQVNIVVVHVGTGTFDGGMPAAVIKDVFNQRKIFPHPGINIGRASVALVGGLVEVVARPDIAPQGNVARYKGNAISVGEFMGDNLDIIELVILEDRKSTRLN